MKILRKNDEFKKMSDSNMEDILKIDSFIKQGWSFCAKKDYKEFFRGQKPEKLQNVETESSDKRPKAGKKKVKF